MYSSGSNSSPLLTLPPEIRNRIYGYVLGGKDLHVEISYDTRYATVAKQKIEITICSAPTSDDVAATEIRNTEDGIELSDWHERHQQCGVHNRSAGREAARSRGDPLPVLYSVALLQTCSQIHSEAALLPFQINNFLFQCSAAFYAFEKKLMPVQQTAIASLSFEGRGLGGPGSGKYPVLNVMREFIGLKKLIVFEQAAWRRDERPEPLLNIRRRLEATLKVFKGLPLQTVRICIHCRRGITWIAPGGYARVSAQSDPPLFNGLCEELETMLLTNLERNYVSRHVEG